MGSVRESESSSCSRAGEQSLLIPSAACGRFILGLRGQIPAVTPQMAIRSGQVMNETFQGAGKEAQGRPHPT